MGKGEESRVVFLGPSLGVSAAREILEARYLPPARRGDVYRVMTSGVETIILIDGVFHNTPSVWQRELLDAMEEGIQIFGASSMGALRAAELHQLGMQGFGVVFEWYRDQLINGDDEVALLHASEEFGYRGLSVPLVNIRYTLAQAVKEGQLTSELERGLLDYVKSLPYPVRTFESVLESPILNDAAADELAALTNYLATKRVDIKRQDAIGVLRHVKALPDALAAALPDERRVKTQGAPVERFSSTRQQFDKASMTRFYSSQGTFDGAELLERAQADTVYVASMRTQLSARRFLREWAIQNQRSCPEDMLHKMRADFSEKIPRLPDWLRANGLTHASFTALLDDFLLINWLESQAQTIFNLNVAAREEEESELAQTYFILDWARQNGVTALEPFAEPELHAADHATPATLRRRRESAFAKWIVAQAPPYFGIEWRFELDLLRWLQINGRAEEVYFQKAVSNQ
jgi:hypothetical protein